MSEASIINLNSTTPETPAGSATVKWQGDDETNPRNVSAYVEPATATAPGAIRMSAGLTGSGDAPVICEIQTVAVTPNPPQEGDALKYDITGADTNGIGGTLVYGAIVGGVNAQTGTSYTLKSSDRGKLVTFSNASAVAVTLPVASSLQTDFHCSLRNLGVGTVTLTPTTSTIDGGSTLALTTGQGCDLFSDNTNYKTQKGSGSGGSASPLTTKGDLYTYSSADARLAVGANGKVLMADSSQTTGIKWATLAESDITNLTTDLAAKLTNPMTTKGDIIVADTSGVPTRVAPGTTGYALISNGAGVAPSYQPVSTTAGAVQYGTRASLPVSPGVSGSCYVCSDTPLSMYISDGTNWNGMFMGIPVADPALNAGLTTVSTKSLSASAVDKTSLGGVAFGGTAIGGSDDVMMQLIPVTPSSTLAVRVNLFSLNGTSGWVIYNSNNNRIVWLRAIQQTLFYSRYLVTASNPGWQANQSTEIRFISPFPSGNQSGITNNSSQNVAPLVGYNCFEFDGTNWYFRSYVDAGLNFKAAMASGTNWFVEGLSAWIGTNYTHVGFGVGISASTLPTNRCWGVDLKIVRT